MAWRIGVDSGGTFTDVCLFDDVSGRVEIHKVSSTPDDPSRGISQGVSEGVEKVGAGIADVGYLGHGTTVGTNALIQLRGAKTGLITSQGFRDLIEIGRQKRPHLYDMNADKPDQLVTRDMRYQLEERLSHSGEVLSALDPETVRAACAKLREQGVDAVAVSFLYSYANSAHEEQALAIIREELPEAFIATSHRVAPEFREYERTSTTVVNAYLGPIMKRYIDRLDGRLGELGLKVDPHLTQSNGGVTSFETAAELPVRTVLSGPSTGVVAAQEIGRQAGMPNLITFDMGGTSSDVALLTDGVCSTSNAATVHGYPIIAPMLDIHTVGAGGGSMAHIDAGGLLKVGPRSAGANPGPVCYGLGNDEPTVTDANVVMQTLNPTHLLDGRMPIDRSLSVAAVERLAERLGLDLMATASGILAVVTANMARAIRVISIQRGYDPRAYALTAFGGAGPLHAARLARELQMSTVLVPRMPGVLCAVGLLLTDLRANFSRTSLSSMAKASPESLEQAFSGLIGDAESWFEQEGVLPLSRQISRVVDIRYEGQNYELSIPLIAGPITAESLSRLEQDFLAAHQRLYGFIAEGDALQIVTIRVGATGQVRKAEFPARAAAETPVEQAIKGHRDVYFPEVAAFVTCPVYARDRLGFGHRFSGPAIVEQMDATTVVLPGMTARVDAFLNLILEDVQ